MKNCSVLTAAIAFAVFLLAGSCAPEQGRSLPNIDVRNGYDRAKELLLTDLVGSVEYVKLETTPECLLGEGIAVKVADRLYIHNSKTKQILVFDRNGKFLGPIGSRGQGPGEYVNFAHFDVSPDGSLVALGGFGEVYLYSTAGGFLRRTRMDNAFPILSGFLFLDQNHLATHQARMNFSQEAFPMMLLWNAETLEADTLLRLDINIQESDLPVSFIHTGFYHYNRTICFMEEANDTLYELNRDRTISPRLVFDCGDLALREESLFMTGGKAFLRIYPLFETREFLLFGVGKGDEYRILAYNKKSRDTFSLPAGTSSLDGQSVLYGPTNNLDGVDLAFNGAKINDGVWCSALQVADLKSYFESGRVENLELATTEHLDQLRELTRASDLNDNPIIRIIHWK